ncbi:hypothetical protein SAMN04487912_103323 [Arthrobacter sp. cf158]|uniref:hypothetical protein n=1 Tax=Arthrobacter sp. cf158 TaxID=1761744 RepID=UPI00089B7CBF|nr:hypothetical protein [Arthrobacter sp. cf158]SDW55051.1 hypothetical protein SAMN04487912_103323 [Arthrobacter sp. cf158]
MQIAVSLAVVVSLTTACSAPSAAPPIEPATASLPSVDRSAGAGARASLNETTGEVVLPMSAYWYSDRENVMVNTAVAFLIYDCVEDAGFTVAPWGGGGKALQDYRYGQWSRSLAARNGAMPEIRMIPGVMDEQPERPPLSAQQQAMEVKCTSSVGRAGLPELLEGLAGDTSLQNQITRNAVALTERDSDYVAFRQGWEECVAAKGLKVAEEGSWNLKSSGSKEDEIRGALLDLDCKEASGGAGKPYDILAQYQAAQMKDHQAQLNALAEEKAAAVEHAKQILRDHGVADARL